MQFNLVNILHSIPHINGNNFSCTFQWNLHLQPKKTSSLTVSVSPFSLHMVNSTFNPNSSVYIEVSIQHTKKLRPSMNITQKFQNFSTLIAFLFKQDVRYTLMIIREIFSIFFFLYARESLHEKLCRLMGNKFVINNLNYIIFHYLEYFLCVSIGIDIAEPNKTSSRVEREQMGQEKNR